MEKKFNETIIIDNGKPIYAINLTDKKAMSSRNSTHIIMRNGEIHFTDYYFAGCEFNFNDEAHAIAKEIFVSQIQVEIKKRILELKQLENIFRDVGLSECFGSVLVDNTKLLTELKKDIQTVNKDIQAVNKEIKHEITSVKSDIESVNADIKSVNAEVTEIKTETKSLVSEAIHENIKPIALKKKR